MHKIFKIVGSVQNKHILLLQGPMGNFFNRLDKFFTDHGAYTFRIGLNAGDKLFVNAKFFTPFRGKLHEWEEFIKNYFISFKIDIIFVFGDCREYQKKAIKVAKEVGVKVFVFEEGYIRPNFITLEENGVNNNSKLPRDRDFYDNLDRDTLRSCKDMELKYFGNTYIPMAFEAALYYIVANLFRFRYPYYKHHRNFSSLLEAFYGIRSWLRKLLFKIVERKNRILYKEKYFKKFYLVALQTYEDFQIKSHSDYAKIEDFIFDVLVSFCKKAPKDRYIVFKHHPMDRGRKNYKKYINSLAKELGCLDRVFIVYDLHLPALLKNAIGTVTINSTVGISSLYHKTPTICLGRAFYDIEGLTSKGISLDNFWREYKEVDYKLFEKFRCYIIDRTQINANFYKPF